MADLPFPRSLPDFQHRLILPNAKPGNPTIPYMVSVWFAKLVGNFKVVNFSSAVGISENVKPPRRDTIPRLASWQASASRK